MKKTKIIFGLLLFMILLSSFAMAGTDKTLLIQFSLTKADAVELIDIRLDQGMPDADVESDYSAVLLSTAGQNLYSVGFAATFEAWADADPLGRVLPGTEEALKDLGRITRDKIELMLKLPYFEDAAKFQIKHNNKVLFEGNVDLCNEDGTCQIARGENFLSCAPDCASGTEDTYCDMIFDGTCDPDCKAQAREMMDTDCTCGNNVCDLREDYHYCPADCGKPANKVLIWTIVVVAVILIIIILIIVLIVKACKRKKRKKAEHKEHK